METLANRNWGILLSLLVTSGILSVYEIVLGLQEMEGGVDLHRAWAVVFSLLVAVWAKRDASARRSAEAFDFAFYVIILWPLVLPYYLAKTRGIEGVVSFFGFVTVYSAPFFLGLMAYSYYS